MFSVKQIPQLMVIIIALNMSQYVSASQVETLTIDTNQTSQPLTVTVTLPNNYRQDNPQRYPVFYTTASNRRLSVITQQLDWMSHVSFGPIPEMIIVQLPYIEAPNQIQDKNARATGLNTKLTIKIYKQHILPLITKTYKTHPFSIIEGYSTNANLPLNILAESPELFNAYVSINPAWGLDKNNLLEKLEKQLHHGKLRHRSLYLSLGSFVQNNQAYNQFSQLVTHQKSGLAISLDDQRHINYYTAPISLLPKALEGIYADTHLTDFEPFAQGGISAVNQYYEKLALKYGYELSPINAFHDLSDYYGQHDDANRQIAMLRHILTLKPDNIFYHIMLSNALLNNKQLNQYKQMINKAKQMAIAIKNNEAIVHINHIIKRNQSSN